ncbi:MAG TPA: hypothetical protein VFZ65_16010 [Planctomycetota bacterium]|nr:hypothetical protein [Planctomycetota bacterium]
MVGHPDPDRRAMTRLETRRQFLAEAGAFAAAGIAAAHATGLAARRELPPIRAITRGPKAHWFGYYDKLEVDPTGRFALAMEVGFEHRSPRSDDEVRIGMVDLDHDDEWKELGRSRAWGWQQGCMLQWRPGSRREVLWNDREGDAFVCRVLDTQSGAMRTIGRAIYTIAPDGRTAMGVDFERIQYMRPGYGYAGLIDGNRGEPRPDDAGLYRIDLDTGRSELVLSIAAIAAGSAAGDDTTHYFNHVLFNPDGTRLVFLHRWRQKGKNGFATRMLTATPDGEDVRVVDGSGHTSHFIWRDATHILAWTRREAAGDAFYLFEDGGDSVEVVGREAMHENGHCSYLPGNQWILNDTYPDAQRLQHPYLFHVATGRVVPLGHFASPPAYQGEWRCDLHPRCTPDGRHVLIDSPHGGNGRQVWSIDCRGIVG